LNEGILVDLLYFPALGIITELDNLVAQLAFLDDKALKRLAKSRLPQKEATRIERLH
jgi:hypothetical protein